MLGEPILVVARLVASLDELAIPYVVGGSLASSVYGIPRATQDVDLVADLELDQVDAFTASLVADFYVDAGMIIDAIKRRASFNVVHLATMYKADIFVKQGDSWSRGQFTRARLEQFEVDERTITIRFSSPEDTLLHKLIWYKLGNEISDRQWGDVLGVIKVQGQLLDNVYLDTWADALDVVGLLGRARREVGGA